MPSDRKQFNVRMSEETAAKVERLMPVVNAALGLELSQAQFFALAVAALEEKYRDEMKPLSDSEAQPAGQGKPTRKRRC